MAEDPFNWSIPRVIYEFSENPQPLWSHGGYAKPIPNVEKLKDALRDNDIDGESLLKLDAESLKSDLGISSFGQKNAILKAISYLRSQSPAYRDDLVQAHQAMMYHQEAINRNAAVEQWRAQAIITPQQTGTRLSHYSESPRIGFGILPTERTAAYTPAVVGDVEAQPVDRLSASRLHPPQSTTVGPMSRENPTLQPLRGLEIVPAHPEFSSSLEEQLYAVIPGAFPRDAHKTAVNGLDTVKQFVKETVSNNLVSNEEETTRKPPSNNFLDHLEAVVDEGLVNNRPDTETEKAQNYRVAIEAHDGSSDRAILKAKKRIAPSTVSHDEYYLPHRSAPLEGYFFPLPGDDLKSFCFASPQLPVAQKGTVNQLMKHFFKQKPISVPGTTMKVIAPYAMKRKAYAAASQSAIVATPYQDTSMQSIETFPALLHENKASRSNTTAITRNSLAIMEADPLLAAPLLSKELSPEPGKIYRKDELGEYQALLEKYPVQSDDDEDLVSVGNLSQESIDEEDWEAIQRDIEEDRQRPQPSILSRQEINDAIDDSIEEIEQQWKETKLTKVQLKGYRRWKSAARYGSREAVLDEVIYWKEHFERSMGRIRRAICSDVWHRVSDVTAQCASIEESMCSWLEYDYYVNILSSTTAPERPARDTSAAKVAARPQPMLADDEEVLESESDVSVHDDNDFIASDSSESELEDIPYGEVLEIPNSPRAERQGGNEDPLSGDEAEIPDSEAHEDRPPSTLARAATPETVISDDDIVTPATRRRTNAMKQEVENASQSSADPLADDSDHTPDPELSNTGDEPKAPAYGHEVSRNQWGTSKVEAIDLTLSSPMASPHDTSDMDFDVQTPDLNPLDDDSPEDMRSTKKAAAQKVMSEPGAASPKIVLSHPSDDSGLPSPEDVAGMRGLHWDVILHRQDQRRALAKAIYSLSTNTATKLQGYIEHCSRNQPVLFRGDIQVCLIDFQKVLSEQNVKHKDLAGKRVAASLFLTYIHVQLFTKIDDAAQADIDAAFASLDEPFRRFYSCLQTYLRAWKAFDNLSSTPPTTSTNGKRKLSAYQEDLLSDSDLQILSSDDHIESADEAPSSNRKKRKREVKESQEAKAVQLDDRHRVQEQELRRALMEEKLHDMEVTNDSPICIINSLEPPIILHEKIAKRVKPHQVRGIQFMWREIIEDKKHQGCLLAHTMGLGKTMQVVSLLVTIAEANKSDNPQIRDQIPKRLRKGKVLILCPPTLLDNWQDELAMWTPHREFLGDVRKVGSKDKEALKRQHISAWAAEGGVLLLGYDKFRSYVLPTEKKKADEELVAIGQMLLDKPSTIIADEAHKMKNAASKIHLAAKKFKSLSRIALTGSPLNNHLEEYHTMVNWIAPGYLGEMVQFKVKYSEPIQTGLYADSTNSERRTALRKLHVLKRDLDPKINRADITAIAKDMPPKTEFFITLELTAVQKEAYRVYVQEVTGSSDLNVIKHAQARLFDWISILSLLCNHPSCFVKKLDERLEEAEGQRTKSIGTTAEDDAGDAVEEGPPTPDVTSAEAAPLIQVMESAKAALEATMLSKGLTDIEDFTLSNRSLIVKEIIEQSVALGDRVLLFSQSIPTLDYLGQLLAGMGMKYLRLTGDTQIDERQAATKRFNDKAANFQVFLISTRAGGLGLNLQGANRVILYDFGFNPTWEEQAIGRAYRLGQSRPVYVYRFRAGNTFEEIVNHKAVFKTQLFQRVVDKKNPERYAKKSISEYLFEPKEVELKDFEDECLGKDTQVLDTIIERYPGLVRNIELTETFTKEDDEVLTAEEMKAAEEEFEDQRLMRDDPAAYQKKQAERYAQQVKAAAAAHARMQSSAGVTASQHFSTPRAPMVPGRSAQSGFAPGTQIHMPSPQSPSTLTPFMQNTMQQPGQPLQSATTPGTPFLPRNSQGLLRPNEPGQLRSYDDQFVRDPAQPQLQARAQSEGPAPQPDVMDIDRPSTPVNADRPSKADCTPQ